MNIILLSGGSGTRLWPLSNGSRSKQFLKIFKKADGNYESILQRTLRLIYEADPSALVTIATSENQVVSIKNQIGEAADLSIEPYQRDTFPAIVLSTAYLHDIKKLEKNEVIVVCPVDSYVTVEYFNMLKKLAAQASTDVANLFLMGIKPTYPSEEYGYIIPTSSDFVSSVDTFREKPNSIDAADCIKKGGLWNSGVFAFKLEYALKIAKEIYGTESYEKLVSNYVNFAPISFDYAVVEKEKSIQVMRFSGDWKDIGIWNTLTETMSDEVIGNAVADLCENTHVINELQMPLIVLGVKNLAIVATPDGILVTEKSCSNKLKNYITVQRPMCEKRIWGEYQILDYRFQNNENNSLTKHIIIHQGHHISYQKHAHRLEIWTIISGQGKIILDDVVMLVREGDSTYIKPGMKHAIMANTELHIIEVQIGSELTEEDIERLDFDWKLVE